MPGETIGRLDNSAANPSSKASGALRIVAPDRQRRFQRRPFSAGSLHDHLVEEMRKRLGGSQQRIILCCGKCRVGSTPLANVFGHAGLPTFYQPIKTLLRHLLVDRACPEWSLATSAPVIFIKETFGPYVEAECSFDPLQLLLDAGFRKEQITLLIIERDPAATLTSWWRCWRDRIDEGALFDRFFAASSNAHQLVETASRHDIGVEYYLHEESKNPEVAMSGLFDRLGLHQYFEPSIVQGWKAGDSLTGSNTAVTFFRQPDDYRIEDIHLNLDEYRYLRRELTLSTLALRQTETDRLAELNRLYQRAKNHASRARQAGFTAAPAVLEQRRRA